MCTRKAKSQRTSIQCFFLRLHGKHFFIHPQIRALENNRNEKGTKNTETEIKEEKTTHRGIEKDTKKCEPKTGNILFFFSLSFAFFHSRFGFLKTLFLCFFSFLFSSISVQFSSIGSFFLLGYSYYLYTVERYTYS